MPKYKATVKDNYIAESAKNHTPSVKIILETDADEHGEVKNFYADLWLTDKTLKSTVKTLSEAFGFEGQLSALSQPILAGKRCSIETKFEAYDGDQFERVNFINPENGLAKTNVASASVVDNLSAKFDAALKNFKASHPTEDDLPF